MDRDSRAIRPDSMTATVPNAPAPDTPKPAPEDHVRWMHGVLGNNQVRDALSERPGAPRPLRDSVHRATAGVEGETDRFASNTAMLRALRRATRPAAPPVPALHAAGGAPLPEGEEARMEAAFGYDFGHVRVHTDGAAARAATALQAHAFTLGAHLFFGPGEWAPGSAATDRLLAHELTHVVQADQGRVPVATADDQVSSPDDPLEREAYANEDRILGRLPTGEDAAAFAEAPGQDEARAPDEVPDALLDRVGRPAPPVVDGTAEQVTARAEAQLSQGADLLGAGTFLREAQPPAPDATDFALEIAGMLLKVDLPAPSAKPVRVEIGKEPLPGLHIEAVIFEFDENGLLKHGIAEAALSMPPWVHVRARLGVDKEGHVEKKVRNARFLVPSLFDTRADIELSALGLVAEARVDAHQLQAAGGLVLERGAMHVRFHPLTGLDGAGVYHGHLPGLGAVTFAARLQDGALSGRVQLHVAKPLAPMPGVVVHGATLVGNYVESGVVVAGHVAVEVQGWASGDVVGAYRLTDGSWSLNGTVHQDKPRKVHDWTLSDGSLAIVIQRNQVVEARAAGTLTSPWVTGHFDGDYDVVQGLFNGTAQVHLRKRLEVGGGEVTELDGTATVHASELVSITGKLEAKVPWEGRPAFRLQGDEVTVQVAGPSLSGGVTLTALRELTFGPKKGTRVIIDQGSSAAAQITDNAVASVEGGLGFRAVDRRGEIGRGFLALTWSEAASLDAVADFTLASDYGFPERANGPAFLKEGGRFRAIVTKGAIERITLVKVGFALLSPHGKGVGRIEGTIDGTWDAHSSTVTGRVDAAVVEEWPLHLPSGEIVLDKGGRVNAEVHESSLGALDLHVPFHATLRGRLAVAVQGNVDATLDAEKGGIAGHAKAKLVQDARIPMSRGNCVVLYARDSDLQVAFGPEGIEHIGVTGGGTYYRGAEPFLSGALEHATWDAKTGEIGFKAAWVLQSPYERELAKGRKLEIEKHATIEVEVEHNALKHLGGEVEFKVSDKEGPLFAGAFKDVDLDVANLTFTGAWHAATKRDFAWPKKGEKEDVAGLQLHVDKGASTSGRIEKNVLERIKAKMHFRADLLSKPLGHGTLDADWDLAKETFTGTGFVVLDDNFPLSTAPTRSSKEERPEDWSWWLVRGSKVDFHMRRNVLQKGKVKVEAVAVRGEQEVLATGFVHGDYKIGDKRGFDGQASFDVKKPLPWKQGDRFAWTVDPKTHLEASLVQSHVTSAHGHLLVHGDERQTEKLVLDAKGHYTKAAGLSGRATVTVADTIDFPGNDYDAAVIGGSGAKGVVEQDDLVKVDGHAIAMVTKKGEKAQIRAEGRVKYAGKEHADLDADARFSVEDPPLDLGAHSRKYSVVLDGGTGGTVTVEHTALKAVDGKMKVRVRDKDDDLVNADIDGRYREKPAPTFSGRGEARLARQVTIPVTGGKHGWTFRLETETHGKGTVARNELEEVDGTLVFTVLRGQDPLLEITGKGRYTGEGTKLSLAKGQVNILQDIPLYTGSVWGVHLRKDGTATARLGSSGLESLFGTIDLGVTRAGKKFAGVDMKGTWTEKHGFHGSGKAALYEAMPVALGRYGMVIDKNEKPSATLSLDKGDVTRIGGTICFRIDQQGKLPLKDSGKDAFLRGELTGSYDFSTFTGKGWAQIGTARRLVGQDKGESVWLMGGTRADLSIRANTLQSIHGDVRLQLRDDRGPYVEVEFQHGSFDAAGGTGFTGHGSAKVMNEKLLFGKPGGRYSFWLEPSKGPTATADIVRNHITEVGGTVPFMVRDQKGDFIAGAVDGHYRHGKVTGKGDVHLARDEKWQLGRSHSFVTFLEGSGGEGEVVDSRLEHLGGTLKAIYAPDDKPLMMLIAQGDYDAVHKNIKHLQGTLIMLRPVKLLGDMIVVNNLQGGATLANNALVEAHGKGSIFIPKLPGTAGTFDVGWRNTGQGEKYHADGSVFLDVIHNPGKKRFAQAPNVRASLDEAGNFAANTKMPYRMSELISGEVDVAVDKKLDPELSGTIVANGVLAHGGNLFSLELPALHPPPIPIWPPVFLEFGAKAGLGISLDDLTYLTAIQIDPFHPLSDGLEVPHFEAGLILGWGVDFEAAAAAWLDVAIVTPVGEAGAGIEGAAKLSTNVAVMPQGRLYSDDGGFHGELGVGIAVEPQFQIDIAPFVYAQLPLMDHRFEHRFEGIHEDLGSLLSFHWNTTTEFGDNERVSQGGPKPIPTPTPPPQAMQTLTKKEPDLGIGEGRGRAGNAPGGPDMSSSAGVGNEQALAGGGGGMGNEFGGLQKEMKTISTVAKGIAGLAYFIKQIKDLVSAFIKWGVPGLIVDLVWKIFTHELSWDKIKAAALAVWAAVQEVADILLDAMPSQLQRIVKKLSGDKPGILDALFGGDDEMRDAVGHGDHLVACLDLRIEMVNQMMSGWCSEDDQTCIVEVLQASENIHKDFPELVHRVDGGPDHLMDKLDGIDDSRAGKIMAAHGITYSTGW